MKKITMWLNRILSLSNLKKVVRLPLFWLILSGYILRIVLMPTTGQHDVMFMPWMTHFISQGHLNIYAYLYEKFGDVVMNHPGVWAPYPYGFYALTAGWLEILQKFGTISLATWNSIWGVAHPARQVFLLKLAYLPFDLSIAYALFRTGGLPGLALWSLSPAAIYTPFMMGQNDIYATAFAVAGVYAATKSINIVSEKLPKTILAQDRWRILSCLLLGIGATFKMYPLLLLPLVVFIMETNWWKRIALLGLGCSIFGLSTLPFITTPTFLNGVLLNNEGVKVFGTTQIFGIVLSPFLCGYLIVLIGALTIKKRTPDTVWLICLATLALLFLLVSTPFYWLVWITPFSIAAIGRRTKLLLAWFILQLGFGLTILTQNHELGVALPIHLSDLFNIPNLPTALTLTHPVLGIALTTFLPIVNGLMAVALLLMVWFSYHGVTDNDNFSNIKPGMLWSAWVPTAIMFLGLASNLYFSRNLVSVNNSYVWQNRTLATNEMVIQELPVSKGTVTGIRLRFADATPSVQLQACLYPGEDLTQQPLACAERNTGEQVENQFLYFIFSSPLALQSDEDPFVKISIESPNAVITMPYAVDTNQGTQLIFSNEAMEGTLDASLLYHFSFLVAFNELITGNVLEDPLLLLFLCAVAVFTILFLAKVYSINFVNEPDGR